MKFNQLRKNPVFFWSAVVSVIIAFWGVFGNASFNRIVNHLLSGVEGHFDWLYILGVFLFLAFPLGLALSKFGRIRLGREDEKAEYGNLAWFSMLFTASMGAGLVFWGVCEPLSHYVAPAGDIPSMSQEALAFSMRSTFTHWGFIPWAIFATMGLSFAYFQFRKGEIGLVSHMFQPLLGEKAAKGRAGHICNILTTVITAIAVPTSFAMTVLQVGAGLQMLFGIRNYAVTWLILIAVMAFAYIGTAVAGLSKGINIMAQINMYTCVILMIVCFLIGPKRDILNSFLVGMKEYLVNFLPDSVAMTVNNDRAWFLGWRIFYWAWWVSWAPFAGTFVGRISRGRTIREYVLGVIVLPSAFCFVWFSIFGGMSFHAASSYSREALVSMIGNQETTLFAILQTYPLGVILCLVSMVLVMMFIITSINSATFMLASLTDQGSLVPPKRKLLFWGILMAVIAFALTLSGNVRTIQVLAIVIAFPYVILLILLCVSMLVDLLREDRKSRETRGEVGRKPRENPN